MIFHLIIRLPPAGFALLPTAVLVEWSVPTMFLTCFALLSAHDLNPCHHIVQKKQYDNHFISTAYAGGLRPFAYGGAC